MSAPVALGFLLGLLALGALLARARLLPANAPETLNAIILYVCLPAAVLRHASRLSFSRELWALAVVPWILTAACVAGLVLVGRLARWPRETVAVLMLGVPLGNTSFLGYPLTAALLGEDALPLAVVFDQLGSFLLLSTFGLVVLASATGGADGGRPTARAVFGRMLRFPPGWALLVALCFMPRAPHETVDAILKALEAPLMPVVGLAVGAQLELRLPRASLAPLGVGLVSKLILCPLLALALAGPLGLTGPARQVVVLEAAMPPMITAMALASAAGLNPTLASALVGYGTVLAIPLLPLWLYLVG